MHREFDDAEAIILNKCFWDDVRNFTTMLIPVVNALRLMDQSKVRAKDVLKIWEALGDWLALALNESDLEDGRKKQVFQLFVQH